MNLMKNNTWLDELDNQVVYEELLGSIIASQRIFSLLIAVCNDVNLRSKVIGKYEEDLSSYNIRSFSIKLDKNEPSLTSALRELIQEYEYLQNEGEAVLTVIGAESLLSLKLDQEKSSQDVFFGYLQWTREALMSFFYPIVLWVKEPVLKGLVKKSPDFWSWRKGVFRFVSKKTGLVPVTNIPRNLPLSFIADTKDDSLLSLEDLQMLIQQIEEEKGVDDLTLATLYQSLGKVYKGRVKRGECFDYQEETELAIRYFKEAIRLQSQ
jgi:tetratricopeptide (TPR) repeat protein